MAWGNKAAGFMSGFQQTFMPLFAAGQQDKRYNREQSQKDKRFEETDWTRKLEDIRRQYENGNIEAAKQRIKSEVTTAPPEYKAEFEKLADEILAHEVDTGQQAVGSTLRAAKETAVSGGEGPVRGAQTALQGLRKPFGETPPQPAQSRTTITRPGQQPQTRTQMLPPVSPPTPAAAGPSPFEQSTQQDTVKIGEDLTKRWEELDKLGMTGKAAAEMKEATFGFDLFERNLAHSMTRTKAMDDYIQRFGRQMRFSEDAIDHLDAVVDTEIRHNVNMRAIEMASYNPSQAGKIKADAGMDLDPWVDTFLDIVIEKDKKLQEDKELSHIVDLAIRNPGNAKGMEDAAMALERAGYNDWGSSLRSVGEFMQSEKVRDEEQSIFKTLLRAGLDYRKNPSSYFDMDAEGQIKPKSYADHMGETINEIALAKGTAKKLMGEGEATTPPIPAGSPSIDQRPAAVTRALQEKYAKSTAAAQQSFDAIMNDPTLPQAYKNEIKELWEIFLNQQKPPTPGKDYGFAAKQIGESLGVLPLGRGLKQGWEEAGDRVKEQRARNQANPGRFRIPTHTPAPKRINAAMNPRVMSLKPEMTR